MLADAVVEVGAPLLPFACFLPVLPDKYHYHPILCFYGKLLQLMPHGLPPLPTHTDRLDSIDVTQPIFHIVFFGIKLLSLYCSIYGYTF